MWPKFGAVETGGGLEGAAGSLLQAIFQREKLEHLRARIKHECKMQERGNFQGAFAYYHANRARQTGCWVPGTQKQAPNNQGSQGTEHGPLGVRRWVWNPPHAVPTGKAGQTGTGRGFRKRKKAKRS